MAAKKRTTESLPSRALEHGSNAFGAKYLRPGFARTPELDLAFALGHGSPAFSPITLLPDLDVAKEAESWRVPIHRNVALSELRGTPLEASPAPLDEAEAARLIPDLVRTPPRIGVLRAVEAMVGPSCVLQAFLTGLENAGEAHWKNGAWQSFFAPLYGVMLRVPTGEAQAARARLETLYEARKQHHGAQKLDILLHGREGLVRSGYKYNLLNKCFQTTVGSNDPSNVLDLGFLDGEADFVAQHFEALWGALGWKTVAHMSGPSPARLFFVGGEATLRTELRAMEGYPGTKQLEAFESYADLHPSSVRELMTRLAKPGGKAQKLAQAWLDALG